MQKKINDRRNGLQVIDGVRSGTVKHNASHSKHQKNSKHSVFSGKSRLPSLKVIDKYNISNNDQTTNL